MFVLVKADIIIFTPFIIYKKYYFHVNLDNISIGSISKATVYRIKNIIILKYQKKKSVCFILKKKKFIKEVRIQSNI